MPQTTRKIVRRGLLATGGTLLAGAVAGKYLRATAADDAPPGNAAQPISSLRAVTPAILPALHFAQADGVIRSLSDYAGRGVVLNFWATWCVPCVSEMPALDALSRALSGAGIVVLAVSEDHLGAAAVRPFYAARGITSLPVLLDPQTEAMQALRLDGIPTTLVIDRKGLEVARIQGAVQWDAPDAPALIDHMVG